MTLVLYIFERRIVSEKPSTWINSSANAVRIPKNPEY
jgi:hypothetical protein